MLTREIAIETVRNFIKSCAEQQVFFTNVVLFGSTATNTATEFSDIDVLLASDQFGYSKWTNLGLISKICLKYRLIEPHTFPTDYYLKGDPFIDEVKKTGIALI